MKMIWKTLLAPLAWLAMGTAHGDCQTTIPMHTPSHDFELHGAWVKHIPTGIVWQRCPLGFQWAEASQTCQADAGQAETYTWANALAAASNNRLDNHSDWRLPNKNEVLTIVERSCVRPALNTAVFPSAGSSNAIWTSTPALFADGYAWRQEFELGEVATAQMSKELNIRLMRSPE